MQNVSDFKLYGIERVMKIMTFKSAHLNSLEIIYMAMERLDWNDDCVLIPECKVTSANSRRWLNSFTTHFLFILSGKTLKLPSEHHMFFCTAGSINDDRPMYCIQHDNTAYFF